jgi:hypothetical protein
LLGELEYLTYHKRQTEKGGFVLACKVGMELKAIIMPSRLHTNEKYTEEIADIAALYSAMSFDKLVDDVWEAFGKLADDTEPPQDGADDSGSQISLGDEE